LTLGWRAVSRRFLCSRDQGTAADTLTHFALHIAIGHTTFFAGQDGDSQYIEFGSIDHCYLIGRSVSGIPR